ncbi:MAG: methionyl-tRNA formyltransferase [Candidatus Aminicenantes bacterium]|nr:methionyl-tRNA formyltransferase [Candidatus Aminicenantes bacterium]
MKVVFFGSPASALPTFKKLLAAGHRIKLVIAQPDKPRGRGKKLVLSPVKSLAQELNLPCFQPPKIRKDPLAFQKIKNIRPDLIVVVAYGQIIPDSIIYLPQYNSVNLHFSLLPKYRGASPVQWALLNGEERTGITIFQLNEKMDEGDILSQEEVKIFPRERAFELEDRLAEMGAELLVRTISQIDKIVPLKQNHAQATYAPKLKKEDGRIDWTKDALFIDRQVRAFNPWPSTFAFFYEKRIKIHEGKDKGKLPCLSSPGKILAVSKEGIEICCGGTTSYLIQKIQPENKKEMHAYAFSHGAAIKIGDTFT